MIKYCIEAPFEDQIQIEGSIQIEGWAISSAGIKSIDIYINGTFHKYEVHMHNRPDVAEAFPDFQDALFSGFSIKLNDLPTGINTILLDIVDTNGYKAIVEKKIEQKKVIFIQDISTMEKNLLKDEGISVSIVIPTYNGGDLFERSISKIMNQQYGGNIQLIILDSGSTDNTVKIAKQYTKEIIEIPNDKFHHARTRNFALQYIQNEYVVFTVQDQIPKDNTWLLKLVNSLKNTSSQAVYAKQIPHCDANYYAKFETEYHSHYLGDMPVIQKISDSKQFERMSFHEALKIVRMDNVCAIYRTEALMKIPFPEVDFAEDMAWAKSIILDGGSITYNPNIEVYHSHNRSPEYRKKRATVDTIFTSLILNKVEHDRSNLDLEKLEYIINKLEFFIESYIHNNYIFSNKITNYIQNVKSVEEILHLYMQHIEYLSNQIFQDYKIIDNNEKSLVVEQITNSLIGCIIGQVYVSHVRKNSLTIDLEAFVSQYRKGV